MLFTNDHRVNYDEAVRRMRFWVNEIEQGRTKGAMWALQVLITMLERERKSLYFESEGLHAYRESKERL
jgi:hypothetical protein